MSLQSKLAQQYGEKALVHASLGADSVQLVVMLYDGAVAAMARAQRMIQQKQYAEKSRLISQAITIIAALREALEMNTQNEIADDLYRLYVYIEQQLFVASRKNDLLILDRCQGLLAVLREAWAALAKQTMPADAPSADPGRVMLGRA